MEQTEQNNGPTASTAMALAIGTRLHEFELLNVIGEGGFSIVYLAYDHSLQRTVAIKEYLRRALFAPVLKSTRPPSIPGGRAF